MLPTDKLRSLGALLYGWSWERSIDVDNFADLDKPFPVFVGEPFHLATPPLFFSNSSILARCLSSFAESAK